MKKNVFIVLLGAIMFSCSSDDESSPIVDIDVSTGDYLPMENGNYWKYDVQGDLQTGEDSLYVSGDVTLGGKNYKGFQTDEPAIGFYSNALSTNGVRKEGDRLLLTGTAMISFAEDFPLNIQLNDFTILNESSANGTVLASVSGTVPYQYQDYTFNFNYTLSSVAMSHLSTYTAPNGEVYTNVIPVMVKLNLSVGTVLSGAGVSLPVSIMAPQDVVISTRYFAKDVGVVNATTDIHYKLANFAQFGVELPLPQTYDAEQHEVLIDYQTE